MFFIYERRVEELRQMTQKHFQKINEDRSLTPEDKKRLKEFYLEHFVVPLARKYREMYLADQETLFGHHSG